MRRSRVQSTWPMVPRAALLPALLLAPLASGQTGDDCTAACEADCMEGDGDCAITFQAQLLAWQADSVASDPGGFLTSWSASTRPCDDWGSTVVCASNAANGVREPLPIPMALQLVVLNDAQPGS